MPRIWGLADAQDPLWGFFAWLASVLAGDRAVWAIADRVWPSVGSSEGRFIDGNVLQSAAAWILFI